MHYMSRGLNKNRNKMTIKTENNIRNIKNINTYNSVTLGCVLSESKLK